MNPAAPGRAFLAYVRRRPRLTLLASVSLALLGLAGVLVYPLLRTQYHSRTAQRAIDRWDFDEALAHLKVCFDDRPESRFLAARTARRAGRLDEAEQYLSEYQKRQGPSRQTAIEWALLRVERGEVEEVEEYLRRTVRPDDPDAPIVLEALARGYLLTDRLGDLLECADLWLQVRPEETHALFWRGLAWERLGRWSDAIDAYGRSLKTDPENADARLHLARLLLTEEHAPEEALGHFEQLHQRRPLDGAAALGLALCHKQLGHTDTAREFLDALLADHPDDAQALTERGRLALDADDLPRAETCLRHAVELASDDREALHSLIVLLWRQGKEDEARKREPQLKQLTTDLARYQEVIRGVAREPRNVGLRTEAGQICLRHGRKVEGRHWLSSALRIDSSYDAARAALAEDRP